MAYVFNNLKGNDRKDILTCKGRQYEFFLDGVNAYHQTLILLYVYQLPAFPSHGLKVGMASCKVGENIWTAIRDRIRNQDHELALNDQEYTSDREVVFWGVCLKENGDDFKDYPVHKEIKSIWPQAIKKQEWFFNTPLNKIKDAFYSYRQSNKKEAPYTPRSEQREAVDKLLAYFKEHPTGERFLLNCKMRFGKSYTTYKYCEEAKLKKILILTFVPAVESSWKEDLGHIETHYDYYTDDDLKRESFDLTKAEEPYVIFLSLQNYLGRDRQTAGTKAKIAKLQQIDFDLVVLDEYHFGAWNDRTQSTIEDLDSEYLKQLAKNEDVLEKFKIKTKKTICLSGTPFKAIATGEFTDNNSYAYTYFDEQKQKYPKSETGDFSEINETYAIFPDMKICGYQMSILFANLTADIFSTDTLFGRKYFSLNKFFETEHQDNPNLPIKFKYEEQVKNWIDIIKGMSPQGSEGFPYSDPTMRQNAKNTLWLLPSRDSCAALADLLIKDDYFKDYQIINLSADEVGTGNKALNFLRKQMREANANDKKGTISITVNKLTLGVTVKEWSSVFVLKDLSSPESYFQSIFRIQTPYVDYLDNGEKNIKKEVGYVYDFNIDRAAALMLKYADESAGAAEKLDIARLIVRYLPIFIDGKMNTPIEYEVLCRLAEFGNSDGQSLSKRIRDTSRTTRIKDDETIAQMLNDPDIPEVLKKVFRHKKFLKEYKKPTPGKIAPPEDGFNSPAARAGRESGYKHGYDDYGKYIDYDSKNIQAAFDKRVTELISLELPSGYSDVEEKWWTNGFWKGYESGVNVEIAKLQCGKEDGIKFVKEHIKPQLGENVVYNDIYKAKINDITHKYLNDPANIPEKYRYGALYNRWYKDSFKKAVRAQLAVKSESIAKVEDVDNALQHILTRLFEFLYISVYRETTFEEIFKNADPDIFLDAVGITKKEFVTLNKYHVFQEQYLDSLIHAFFINESLGKRMNLENKNGDNKEARRYRNSFGFFGYGPGNDDYEPPECVIPESGQPLTDVVRYSANKMSNPNQEEAKPNLNSDLETIIAILKRHPKGLKASQIASKTKINKKVVNYILYSNRILFQQNGKYWTLK